MASGRLLDAISGALEQFQALVGLFRFPPVRKSLEVRWSGSVCVEGGGLGMLVVCLWRSGAA
eukprot:12013243-Alexandrium_andersonii.AAC.1